MLNLGMVGIEASTGNVVYEYEANLTPLPNAKYDLKSNEFWNRPENLEALVYICDERRDPAVVMIELASGITELQSKYQIETIGYPIAYDWQWINWYFVNYIGTNPLGYTGRDISSYKWATRSSVYPERVAISHIELPPKYKKMPKHSGLVDAYTQGMYFWKMHHLNTTIQS